MVKNTQFNIQKYFSSSSTVQSNICTSNKSVLRKYTVYFYLNGFYTNNQFYFKKFSLILVHSLIVKKFLFQAIQIILTVLINNSVKHKYTV